MAETLRCPTCSSEKILSNREGDRHACETCGHKFTTAKPHAALRIFLSYGHDDNEELVRRIKADLEKRGHDVWFDKSEIKAGDDWRRSITEGIAMSDKFVSFLSKHSTRDPGVCRDEIAIAIGVKGGNIQTILVESEQEVKPPVNIGHIQWLDMHDWKEQRAAGEVAWERWYQAKLAEIVRVVESDESRRFAGEIETLNGHLKPIKSEARICQLLGKGFYGRQWLFEAVEKWRNSKPEAKNQEPATSPSRLFWIMGAPGVGKSAFAAQLTHTRGDTVIAAQFCEWDKPDHRNAPRVVRSLAFQLATRLPDYRKLLLTLPEIAELDRKDAAELFDYLLANPLRSVIHGGRERYLIVIDALDEAGEAGRNPLVEMLARNSQRLPGWLGLVVTSRPEFDVKTPLQALNPFPLDTQSESNRADIRDYLRHELATQLQNRPDADRLVEQILEKSEGVFLYVERFCDDVQRGHLSLDRPEQFPQGLGGIFCQYFQRQFPDLEKFRKDVRPALRAILAAREPLPMEILQRLFHWQDEELRDFTRTLGSMFTVTKEANGEVIKPYHKSLADWLADEAKAGTCFVSVKEGHMMLAGEFHKEWQTTEIVPEAYWAKYANSHLRRGGELEAAALLFANSRFQALLKKYLKTNQRVGFDVYIASAHADYMDGHVSRLELLIQSAYLDYSGELLSFLFPEDIPDFVHWQVSCHRALRDSRFFIACLSRTYLRSDACRWEWEEWCRHELERGLVGQGAALLWFVKLEDIDAPEDAALLRRWKGDLLQRFQLQCHEWWRDDHGALLVDAEQVDLQQLTEHIAQRLRLLTLDHARRGNLPWPNANFVGREPEFASLRAALLDAPERIPTGIHGIGGMGKTVLAQAFAYGESDAFSGGCWLLRCAGANTLATAIRQLDLDLGIALDEKDKQDDFLVARRVLAELERRAVEGVGAGTKKRKPPQPKTLLLLDDVDRPALLAQEQMKLLADQPWARVLYTTRLAPDDFTKAGAKIRPLDLDRLPENQAVDLIRRYQPGQAFASPEHEAAAREIVRELSGLPLAMETAAVYLGQCDPRVAEPWHAVDARNYLNQLREQMKSSAREGAMNTLREVAHTLRPTLSRLDAPTRTVLQISSILAPDCVALPWVRAIAGQRHPEVAANAPVAEVDPWIQLIRSLIGMRLLQPTPEPRVVAMHPILQRALESELLEGRETLDSRLEEHVRARCAALENVTKWEDACWELKPLGALAERWADTGHSQAAWLLSQSGQQWLKLGEWSAAEPLLRRALAIDRASFGDDHPNIVRDLHNLAQLLQATNRSVEAEAIVRRGLRTSSGLT